MVTLSQSSIDQEVQYLCSSLASLISKPQIKQQVSDFRILLLPTFTGAEETVHLHAGARVGHAEGRAGNQSLLWWAAVRGPDQTPPRPLARSLQQLNRLTWREGAGSFFYSV